MARVATDVPAILAAVKTKLTTTANLFPADNVFVTDEDDRDVVAVPPSARFLALKWRDGSFDQGLAAGAGTNAVGIDGSLEASLYCRTDLDRLADATQYLTGTTGGGVVLGELIQALHMFDPTSGSDKILREPMRGLRLAVQGRKIPGTKYRKLETLWDVKFAQRVNYAARTPTLRITSAYSPDALTPVVVTTATAHGFGDGTPVVFVDAGSLTGTHAATTPGSTTTFPLGTVFGPLNLTSGYCYSGDSSPEIS